MVGRMRKSWRAEERREGNQSCQGLCERLCLEVQHVLPHLICTAIQGAERKCHVTGEETSGVNGPSQRDSMWKRWDRNPDSCAPVGPQARWVDLEGGRTPRSENRMEVNTGSQSKPCCRDRENSTCWGPPEGLSVRICKVETLTPVFLVS